MHPVVNALFSVMPYFFIIICLRRVKPCLKEILIYMAGLLLPVVLLSTAIYMSLDFYIFSTVLANFTVVTLVLVTRIREKSLPLCIIYGTLTATIVFMSAAFTSIIFEIVSLFLARHFTPEVMRETLAISWQATLLYCAVVSIFGAFIALAMGKFILAKMSVLDEKMKKKAILYLFPGVLATYMMFLMTTFVVPIFWGNEGHSVIHAVIFAGVFVVLIYSIIASTESIQKQADIQLKDIEKEYYHTQCRLMQESVENMNSIHHDMKFHLAAARDFITNDKSDEATNYLDGLLDDVDKSVIHSNTKNTAFDSIINYKLKNAGQENIKLDLRLLIPPSLNIEVADIVIIIGNLLDNALDAVSKVEEKFIKLDIEYSRESLFILVENTFDGVVKYTGEADDKGRQIITLKAGGEHGHGLKNIRKSVEKYNGHFETNHKDNNFSVTILLYVK
jgi:sensor histidine kinase YesM